MQLIAFVLVQRLYNDHILIKLIIIIIIIITFVVLIKYYFSLYYCNVVVVVVVNIIIIKNIQYELIYQTSFNINWYVCCLHILEGDKGYQDIWGSSEKV